MNEFFALNYCIKVYFH